MEELQKDAARIIRGPDPDELTLLYWNKPMEAIDDRAFRPTRESNARFQPTQLAISKDAKLIACTFPQSTKVFVQDVATGISFELQTRYDQPDVAFNPDGKLLATGGYGTRAQLWDLEAKREIRLFELGTRGAIRPVFSPDGKTLAVGNRNGSSFLFRVDTGALIAELPRRMTQEIAFRPDGQILATAYVNGTVALWETSTGKLLHSEPTGGRETYTLDWSPKGDLLVTGGNGGKIVVWDSRLKRLKDLDSPSWVNQVRFTRDGSRLLTSGGSTTADKKDRRIVIWGVD
jgi:WD40 repeat protein